MKLTIHPKSVYGTEKFYPGCEHSHLFAKLLKQSTFTERDMAILRALGYTLEFKYVFTTEQSFI